MHFHGLRIFCNLVGGLRGAEGLLQVPTPTHFCWLKGSHISKQSIIASVQKLELTGTGRKKIHKYINLRSSKADTIVLFIYKDHTTEQEKVIILCVLPSGAMAPYMSVRARISSSGHAHRYIALWLILFICYFKDH